MQEQLIFTTVLKPSYLEKFHSGLQYVHRWLKWSECAHAPKSQQQPNQVYSIMILPQVHLRKPCYDFYFL
jgi:hypothetical protein